jgi:hypothetical protein
MDVGSICVRLADTAGLREASAPDEGKSPPPSDYGA